MKDLLPYVGILLSLISLAYAMLRARGADATATEHRFTKIEAVLEPIAGAGSRLSVLENQMALLWKNVGFAASTALHSPHPERAELDSLIEKFQREELDWAEIGQFRTILQELQKDEHGDKGERLAAGMMLAVLEVKYQS